jgi:hypothetical protein
MFGTDLYWGAMVIGATLGMSFVTVVNILAQTLKRRSRMRRNVELVRFLRQHAQEDSILDDAYLTRRLLLDAADALSEQPRRTAAPRRP